MSVSHGTLAGWPGVLNCDFWKFLSAMRKKRVDGVSSRFAGSKWSESHLKSHLMSCDVNRARTHEGAPSVTLDGGRLRPAAGRSPAVGSLRPGCARRTRS